MGREALISVKEVSKKFCRNLARSIKYGMQDVARDLMGIDSEPERLRGDEFWAVDNVSFELRTGETLGIIGPNGSGKTTILKMLNGIFMPDKGRIEVQGKVGALIAIGAGFHPLLSGRENIYVSGAILGMSKKEIDKKFDSIVEFADIGDFLDSPVKFYSDGMYVKLGFAVAIHCEPDILLIDEILSVGDLKFQSKCFKFLTDSVIKKGCSVIFISHNRYAIQDVCSRALYLKNGKMMQIGDAAGVIERYLEDTQKQDITYDQNPRHHLINEEVGGVTKLVFTDKQGNVQNKFKSGEEIHIRFYYSFKKTVVNPSVGITFMHSDLRYSVTSNTDYVFNLHSGYDRFEVPTLQGEGYFEVTIDCLYIPIGIYKCFFYLFTENKMNLMQKNENAAEIEILWLENSPKRSLIELPHKWKLVADKNNL